MTETVHQAPVFQAGHPLALFRQKAAFTGFQPTLHVVRADPDVTVFRGNVHIAHDHQRLVVTELAFQQLLQIAVEAFLGREFGRVVATFALREIAVHDGHRHVIGVGERAPDKAPLGIFIIGGEAFVQRQRFFARQQGDAVVTFLSMEIHVVAQGSDFIERKLVVMDLGFLQPDHVGLVFVDQRRQLMGTGTQPVDVEGDDLHGRQSWQKGDAS